MAFRNGLVHSFATLPDGQFLRMTGTYVVTRSTDLEYDDRRQRNKSLKLEASHE
jgi:hypothetical protein